MLTPWSDSSDTNVCRNSRAVHALSLSPAFMMILLRSRRTLWGSSGVPLPVQTEVRRFLHDADDPDPCGYTELGPIDVVREFYFSDGSREIAEFLDAALMIGMGVRVSNEVDSDGVIDWRFELRSEEAFVPASAEPRSWLLPEGLRSISTWTSRESTGGDPVRAALRIAQEAARQGRYVRIHTFACGASDDLDDTLTSEIAVDVLDAPAPLAQD